MLDSCRSTVHANLQVLKLGCKKTLQYSQAFNVKNLQVRKMFLKRRCLKENRASLLTYLDETGYASSSYRTRARAVKGKRVHGKCRAHQCPRTSLIRYLVTQKTDCDRVIRRYMQYRDIQCLTSAAAPTSIGNR